MIFRSSRPKEVKRNLIMSLMVAFGISFIAQLNAETMKGDINIVKAREKFTNGFPADPDHFPLMVWLQQPANALKYKEIGINTYFHIVDVKSENIETLKAAGMHLICAMTEESMKYRNDKTIVAWSVGDEPENWQHSGVVEIKGKKWDLGSEAKRIPAKDLTEMYQTLRNTDVTRPVIINFSCGLANTAWGGRGGGWKDSMYTDYMKACDVASYDVYPTTEPEGKSGKRLWWQAKGLDRMKSYAGSDKPRFNCIGTNFTGEGRAPRPEETRTEIWMSIIHGSKGLVYFCHNFKPKFQEAALLEDPVQRENVKKINAEIKALAPVINSADYDGAEVSSSSDTVPIDILVKKYKDETYLFAVAMKMGEPVTGTFQVKGVSAAGKVEVIGENRTLDIDATGKFQDEFKKWETHNYKVVKK